MKKIISFLLIFPLLSFSAFAFTDVPDTQTYKTGIDFLFAETIINGYPDGTYKPNQTLNRAEMMKIVAEGAKKFFGWSDNVFDPYQSQKCFSDVAANQWYTKYICYGKEKGWIKGYSNNTFKPSQTVTFVEGLKIVHQGFALGYSETQQPWYKDVVEKASSKNYIPFTIKSFNDGLKRDQMADLIARIIKDKRGELETYLGSRANVQVTYTSISEGRDLSTLGEETVCVGGKCLD